MGWDMLNWSYSVVRKNPKLLLFPALSGGSAAVAAVLCIAFHRSGYWSYPWLFLWYTAVTFVIVFSNCALAVCALAFFAGEKPTVGYGFSRAAEHLGDILLWSLFSSTVGLAIRFVERWLSLAGRIAVWLFGAAWELATFFVVPILVAEGRGPIAALRRSTQLLPSTWGDQLTARIRLGWRGLALFAPALFLGIAGAARGPYYWMVAIAYGVLVAAFLTAANGIFEAALYRYAAYGETPAGWSPEFLSLLPGPDQPSAPRVPPSNE